MTNTRVSGITRQQLLRYLTGGFFSVLAVPLAGVRAVKERISTPAQTEGPFYPRTFPDDIDEDLSLISGNTENAQGQVIEVKGQIRDTAGEIIPSAIVEIWHCDVNGTYHHSRDRGQKDSGFQGFGRTRTNSDGQYHFKTIKPAAYTGRTPHIHFKVKADGYNTLTTQMYFDSEAPQNQRDGIYHSLGRVGQSLVTVSFGDADQRSGVFDITLQA